MFSIWQALPAPSGTTITALFTERYARISSPSHLWVGKTGPACRGC